MKRRLSLLPLVALGLSLAGCAMCQSPFDYCNAVIGPCGPNCNWGARHGSVFAPMDEGDADPQLGPTPAEPPPTFGKASPAARAGEPRKSASETTASDDAVDTLVR